MKLFLYELICAGGLGPNTPNSLRAEGWAMLEALVQDFDNTGLVETITLLDSFCPKPLGGFCRRAHVDEHQVFQELTASADMVLVIAPEFDNLLAGRSRQVLDAGKILLGSAPAAIELTGDKWALARHFAQHRVPSPETTLLTKSPAFADPRSNSANQRSVLKPRHGAGSQATYLISHNEEFSSCYQKARQELPGADFVLQPFIPGQPASVTFLVGPSQKPALQPAAQHLSTDGRFYFLGGSLPLPAPLAERAVILARQAVSTVPGLAGLVGVDLILGTAEDGSQDWVIEINPRPTTSYVGLRQLAIDNLAQVLLAVFHGEEVKPIRWRQGVVHFSATGGIKYAKG
jgi:predicted ATP-grasp superfamily ATP-dependent carboligase